MPKKPKKNPIAKTQLTDDQIKKLLDIGVTVKIINNMCNKGWPYEKMLKQAGKKAEQIEARKWLQKRYGKNMKIPKRKLPKLTKKQLEQWQPKNPNQVMRLTFPMLPSANHMYHISGSGARVMDPVTRKLFAELQDYVEEQVKTQNWEPTYNTHIIADMWFYFPDKMRRDNHNMFKFLFDLFNGIAIDDDCNLLPRVQRIEIDKQNPRIEMKLHIQRS